MSDVATGQGKEPQASPKRAICPPHLVLGDFLGEETAAGLLEYALAHEAAFGPTRVGDPKSDEITSKIRVSVGTRELGAYRKILRDRLLERMPELIQRLRVTPVTEPRFELELVAHNDGAFYKRHIDTQMIGDRRHIRVLSGVYYFHTRPKAFTGGALRLYAIGDPDYETFTDIEPGHNTMLVFPAWAPHEVMPVSCPSQRFSDSRFAVNCWVYWEKSAPAQ